VLRGHDGVVGSAAFSPDGARVVTASLDGTARIWDAAAGQTIGVLNGDEGGVLSAAFSPDGGRVVIASEHGTARVWDASTGQTIAVLRGHKNRVNGAAFSPDGARVVTGAGLGLGSVLSRDRLARVWDAATGQTIAVLKGHEHGVSAARFSPDGKRVLTASLDKTPRIWDISGIPKGDTFHIACAWLPDHYLTDIARIRADEPRADLRRRPAAARSAADKSLRLEWPTGSIGRNVPPPRIVWRPIDPKPRLKSVGRVYRDREQE
jgi:WD40 repeat protein